MNGKRSWLNLGASGRDRTVVLLSVWVFCFIAIRALSMDADPPQVLPNGLRSQELWAEGAAKAQEARNWALFGKWQTSPADNYQFWRAQSPVWVYSLAGFLKAFGVRVHVLRWHSIYVSAIGFGLTMWYGRQKLGATGWFGLGLLLAGNYYYVLYTRVGLIEPMVNLFAAAMVLFGYYALSRPLWLIPAAWALVLATFSKMSGLYLLPVFVVCAGVSFSRARGLPRRAWLIPTVHALLLFGLVALYMSSDTYRQRTVWNIAHMGYNADGQTEIDPERLQLGQVLSRLVDWERWKVAFFSLFPVAATLSVVTLVHAVKTFVRERELDWDVLTLSWFGMGFASLQATGSTYPRFYLILFPPIALLGARGLDIAVKRLPRFRVASWAAALTLAAAVAAIDGRHYADWWSSRTFHVRDINRKMRKLMHRQEAVFIGMWAPWLMFDTGCKFYTVRSYFNVSKEGLRQLGVTHLLLRERDLSGALFRRQHKAHFDAKQEVARFNVHGSRVTLYRLRNPLE